MTSESRLVFSIGVLLFSLGCGDDSNPTDGGPVEDAEVEPGDAALDMDAGAPVDECADGTHDCPADARCVDDPVGFHCACLAPLVGDGRTCVEPPVSPPVAVGELHSCAILDGDVRCFGGNRQGQLGDGARRAPEGYSVDVALPAPAVDVSVGRWTSCAVLETGALYCWGRGITTGVATDSLTVYAPTRVGTASDWRAVSIRLADQYACGLRASELHCWGDQVPPLGLTLTPEPELVGTVDWSGLSTPLCGVTPAATFECWEGETDGGPVDAAPGLSVARGDEECVVTTEGSLYCRSVPASVETAETVGAHTRIAFGDDWVDVASSSGGFCGVRADGRIHCAGQQSPRDRVGILETPLVATEPMVAVVRGGSFTHCAVGLSGAIHCWGRNADGQVGVGTRGTQPLPTRVGDASWTSISGRLFDTCGTREDGSVHCWGETYRIDASATPPVSPEFVDEPVLHHEGAWTSVTGDGSLRLLLDDEGALFAVGEGTTTGLGEGMTYVPEPTRVGDQLGWTELAGFTGKHTCGIRAGELYCWGDGGSAQTGDPTRPSRVFEPTRVGAESDWTAVAASDDSTCAIRGGELYCFGSAYGEGAPVRLGEALGPWTDVALDDRSGDGCGIAAGAIYCWGRNSEGERVPGGPSTLDDPTQVGSATDWTDVSLGASTTCGLRGAGELYCWGVNYEAFVDGAAEVFVDVTRVSTLDGFTELLQSRRHACALRAGGELYCWGESDNGALGHGTAWVDAPTPI